jgi:hypothetical protein
VAAAHRQIVALIEEANATLEVGAADLAGDAVQFASERSAAELELAAVASGEERLRALPAAAHVVVPAGAVPLISCFNVATALIGDVSSVLTDFVASDKPMAVCDPQARDQDDFESLFPSAAAGIVLPPREADLHAFLDVVVGGEPEAAVSRRRSVRYHLLGPDEPPALQRFSAALDTLSSVGTSQRR